MIPGGRRFDDSGNVVEVDVIIVWGAPASGKTTHVRKNMEPGDLIVDLDLIKQALSMASKTAAADNLLETALSVRDHLYELIGQRRITCNTVWVVAGLPKSEDRDRLIAKLRPTSVVHIEATGQECVNRAMLDADRLDKEQQKAIIRRWFRQFYYEDEG